MPLFLINQYGKQELIDLPNDKHINGEILWRDDKHGPLPDGVIVGAMDLELTKEIHKDEFDNDIEVEVSRKLVLSEQKHQEILREKRKKEIEDAEKLEKESFKDSLLAKLKSKQELNLSELNSLMQIYFNKQGG